MPFPSPRSRATDHERVQRFFHDPDGYDHTRFRAPAARARAAWASRCFTWLLPISGRDERVLEVGAGTGRFTSIVQRGGAHVTAIDLSAEMASYLGRAARKAGTRGRCDAVRADAFALPFRDGAFDAGVCMSLIGRFAGAGDQASILRELCRVVRPGGWVLFNLRNPHSVSSLWRGKGGLTARALRERGAALGLTIVARRRVHVVHGRFVRRLPSGIARLVVALDRLAVAIPGVPAHNVLYRAHRLAPSR